MVNDIESIGTVLSSNTRNEYYLTNSDGCTDVTANWQGRPMGPDSLSGWQAIRSGSDGADGYSLLWQHESGARAIWALDSTGARIGDVDMADAIDYEDRFAFDIDGDGIIGEWCV